MQRNPYQSQEGQHIDAEDINLDALAGGTISVDGVSRVVELGHRHCLDLALVVTAVSASDTLDATFQGSADGVNNWYTVHTFAQVSDVATERVTVPCPKFGRMNYNVTGSDVAIAATCRGQAR